MIEREKVIRAVETCFDSWIDKHRNMGLDLHEVEQLKCDALELLKEQEPVMPELRIAKYGSEQWIVCGNCYWKVYGGDNYCCHCGRKLKWE